MDGHVDQNHLNDSRPVAIDLFGGAGGISLGFEAAGFDIAVATDIDPIHCATHVFNFPYSRAICADLRELGSQVIEEHLAEFGAREVDVVVGGPPCQGFSNIGHRQLDDPRNRLVFEFFRIVRDLRPKYFVFENVPGIVARKHKIFVDELRDAFSGIRYSTIDPPQVLNASHFGVAQNRKRFILIGWREDCRPLSYPEGEYKENGSDNQQIDMFGNANGVVGSREAIGDLEDIPIYLDEDRGIPPDQLDYSGYRESFAFSKQGLFSLCHKRTFKEKIIYGHYGSKHTSKSVKRFAETPPGQTESISRFYKLHPDRPCHTIRAGTASDRGAYTAPRPIHYKTPRCLSIREGARLHSYPDWFQLNMTIWHGFRQIGNSVAPIFAKCIADEIIKALDVVVDEESVKTLNAANIELLKMPMTQACEYFGVPNNMIEPRKRLVVANSKEG